MKKVFDTKNFSQESNLFRAQLVNYLVPKLEEAGWSVDRQACSEIYVYFGKAQSFRLEIKSNGRVVLSCEGGRKVTFNFSDKDTIGKITDTVLTFMHGAEKTNFFEDSDSQEGE